MPPSRIYDPTAAPQLIHARKDGPLVFPASAQGQTPEGPAIFSFGGLTKMELGTLLIGGLRQDATPEECAARARNLLKAAEAPKPTESTE